MRPSFAQRTLRLGTAFAGGAALILGLAAAGADPIPQEWIKAQHASCLQACAANTKTPNICETYCTCIDRGFATTLTKADYMEMDTDVKNKQPMSEALSTKVQTVEDHCLPQ